MRSRFVTTTLVWSTTTTTNVSPNPPQKTTGIPIHSSENEIQIPVHFTYFVSSPEFTAAVKIQSVYRSHLVRTLLQPIAAVKSEADRFESRLRQQETVDLIRRDEKERLRMNEQLMAMLLKLDSVRGLVPAVRELRRSLSRRIVGLQEIVDAVSCAEVGDVGFFPVSWEDMAAGIGKGCGEEGQERVGGDLDETRVYEMFWPLGSVTEF